MGLLFSLLCRYSWGIAFLNNGVLYGPLHYCNHKVVYTFRRWWVLFLRCNMIGLIVQTLLEFPPLLFYIQFLNWFCLWSPRLQWCDVVKKRVFRLFPSSFSFNCLSQHDKITPTISFVIYSPMVPPSVWSSMIFIIFFFGLSVNSGKQAILFPVSFLRRQILCSG